MSCSSLLVGINSKSLYRVMSSFLMVAFLTGTTIGSGDPTGERGGDKGVTPGATAGLTRIDMRGFLAPSAFTDHDNVSFNSDGVVGTCTGADEGKGEVGVPSRGELSVGERGAGESEREIEEADIEREFGVVLSSEADVPLVMLASELVEVSVGVASFESEEDFKGEDLASDSVESDEDLLKSFEACGGTGGSGWRVGIGGRGLCILEPVPSDEVLRGEGQGEED